MSNSKAFADFAVCGSFKTVVFAISFAVVTAGAVHDCVQPYATSLV